uniref:Uncharacterized protein n=1 Tax=Glossina austeni TaxID=7395 RepID=A0A1A9UPF8_GLOAU
MANNALSSQQNKYDRLLGNVAIPENRYRSIDVVFLKYKIRPVPHRLVPQLNRIHKPSTPKKSSIDSIKMKRDCVSRALSNMMRRPPKREHQREMPDSCKPTVVPSPPPDKDEAAAADRVLNHFAHHHPLSSPIQDFAPTNGANFLVTEPLHHLSIYVKFITNT